MTTSSSNVVFIFVMVYLLTCWVYVSPSGSPQPADFAMVLAIAGGILFARMRFPKSTWYILLPLIGFVYYVVLISTLRTLETGDMEPLKHARYYVFNLLVVIVLSFLVTNKRNLINAVMVTLCISVIILFVLQITLFNFSASRQRLLFNNPNQLAYFGILCASIFGVCIARCVGSRKISTLGFLISTWYVLISLSLSALTALGLLVTIVLLQLGAIRVLLIGAGTVLALTISLQVADPGDSRIVTYMHDSWDNRFGRVEEKLEDEAARGYPRLVEFPEYLIFGAGEGARWRFGTGQIEIHSSWATILFSYGIPGTLLFGTFIWILYKNIGFGLAVYILPAAGYSITHQGLRFTLFWILLVMLIGIGNHQKLAARSANSVV